MTKIIRYTCGAYAEYYFMQQDQWFQIWRYKAGEFLIHIQQKKKSTKLVKETKLKKEERKKKQLEPQIN